MITVSETVKGKANLYLLRYNCQNLREVSSRVFRNIFSLDSVTDPCCAFWRPERIFNRLVFPAPFGPIMTKNSPADTPSETFDKIDLSWKFNDILACV